MSESNRDRAKAPASAPWLYLAIALAALAFGLPLVQRAIILSDEGYLLQQALDLLNGRVLYRDMDAFITPGMWFLIAGTFAVFGPSVIVSRYLILAAYVVLNVAAFKIVEGVAGRRAGMATVACMLLFSVWAFPAWTFAFYSPLAVLLAMLGLERLLAWQRSGQPRDLFLVGLLLGLSVCFKQNYGVFAIAGGAIGYGAHRLTQGAGRADGVLREVGLVLAGGVLAGLPFLAYLIAHGAIPAAWDSLVVHPFEFGGRHDIPFAPLSDLWRSDLYSTGVEKLTYLSYPSLRAGPIGLIQPFRGTHRLHALAYWLPVMIFGAGLVLSFLRRDTGRVDVPLLTIVTTCGAVFLGVLPRADFNHLVNVYQPVIIAGAVVVQRGYALASGRGARIAWASAPSLVVFVYGSIALVWYTALIDQHSAEIDVPRGGVYVGPLEADEIDYQLRFIDRYSDAGDAVLTIPDLTMLNFLADRSVPSAFYNLYEHHIAKDRGEAVAAGAEAQGVELAITRYDNFFSDRVGLLDYAPGLSDYLISHFERQFVGADEDYIFYTRREAPMPIHPFADALADCTASHPLVDIRSHLLFSSLYHRSRANEPMPVEGLSSRCRVRVPDAGGILALEIGYHRPHANQSATRLIAMIGVATPDQTFERLHTEVLRVVARRGALREQPFKLVELDLGPWAGQEVDLVFESRLEGQVRTHPLDWKGFALIYRDPRVQAEAGGARP